MIRKEIEYGQIEPAIFKATRNNCHLKCTELYTSEKSFLAFKSELYRYVNFSIF